MGLKQAERDSVIAVATSAVAKAAYTKIWLHRCQKVNEMIGSWQELNEQHQTHSRVPDISLGQELPCSLKATLVRLTEENRQFHGLTVTKRRSTLNDFFQLLS
jgi:hypothetical protein